MKSITISHPRKSHVIGLGQGLRICISRKFSHVADAAGLESFDRAVLILPGLLRR